MREVAFLRQNTDKWQEFERLLEEPKRADPDQLATLFVRLTDDLAYARTFYAESKTTRYLNGLTLRVHQAIYRNKKEKGNRLIEFWRYELPTEIALHRRELLYALAITLTAAAIGTISVLHDDSFIRVVLGDDYVNMTLENIAKGDPMAVYKRESALNSFVAITNNNVRVSFNVFAGGLLVSIGTALLLFYNGIMIGAFVTFCQQQGVLGKSMTAVWLHGTLEISAIIIAGGAGLVLGNSILFPGTYTRVQSLMRGAKSGLKIIVGLVPIFLIAGFLEGFVTRHTDLPAAVPLSIILLSLTFIIGYFVIYPIILEKRISNGVNGRENPGPR